MAHFILLHVILTSVMCSIASINKFSLRSSDRRQTASNHFTRNKYDIILIQETNWTPDFYETIKHKWHGNISFSHGT